MRITGHKVHFQENCRSQCVKKVQGEGETDAETRAYVMGKKPHSCRFSRVSHQDMMFSGWLKQTASLRPNQKMRRLGGMEDLLLSNEEHAFGIVPSVGGTRIDGFAKCMNQNHVKPA